jgi:UDP-N-acetylglucosamine 2-epimerase (non-hydrolysing)
MNKKKILICVGTRPNLIKITQFDKILKNYPEIEYRLLHTGQHYDYNMNSVFFDQLGIREPDLFLNISQGTQIEVISQILVGAEKYMKEYKPDLVVVPGDVNSTFACGFVARYLGIKLAHLESGLRSFDITMPEENNRKLVDSISDYYFITEPSGIENLRNENISEDRLFYVGNTMIDTLVNSLDKIEENNILSEFNLNEKSYFLFTFHRPVNVDSEYELKKLTRIVSDLSQKLPIVFPVHPRTLKKIKEFGLSSLFENENIRLCEPLGYFEFMKLVKSSKAVVTDSGGIQEETTYLGIPCLTIRQNTERPVTIDEGTNTLINMDVEQVKKYIDEILNNNYKKGKIPEFWDGKATERIVDIIVNKILN